MTAMGSRHPQTKLRTGVSLSENASSQLKQALDLTLQKIHASAHD